MRLEGTGKDGSGINQAKVNDAGEQLVFSISEEEIEHVSERDGLSFSWSSGIVASVSAGGTVLSVQNTSKTHELHIEHIVIANGNTASAVTIHVIRPDSAITPSGTSNITGFCLNTGKAEVAEAVSVTRDTANSTQGTIIGTEFMEIDSNVEVGSRGLILATNAIVAVDHVVGTSEAAVSIVGFYKKKEV